MAIVATAAPDPAMRLTQVYFDNFKSLLDFKLPLAKLSCLIGLNGTGKSTVLQALDFAGRLFRGNISGWLAGRNWDAADLNSRLINRRNIDLRIQGEHAGRQVEWHGSFNRGSLRCTKESLLVDEQPRLRVADGAITTPHGETLADGKIAFDYQGSVLSRLKRAALPDENLWSFVDCMRGITSLELLSPQALRRRTDKSFGAIGLGGERLSAFLHDLPPDKEAVLTTKLVQLYPQLRRFHTRSLRRGWKELLIAEQFGEKRVYTEATHINDGMLRLMAILAETLTDATLLMFDEIENGINPELVESLLDTLIDAPQQVLVTTHSPMILNFLDDATARAGVQYLWRDADTGATRTHPFFAIPSLHEKLRVMGPGEAFVDTDLTRLAEEITTLAPSEAD